jgi:integrase
MQVSPVTKDNAKRAISRFFSWTIARPRCWRKDNPASLISIATGKSGEPDILTVSQCERLLRAAEANKLAPYVAVALFAGLRPFEIRRLTWDRVNLSDKEIRITADSAKTGKGRVVAICDTLAAWLAAYKKQPFFPPNFDRIFEKARKEAGIVKWPVDVLRHSAISYFFRKSGSYGLAAERFGNSEQIIKAHYAGRVSTAETEKFYGIMPKEKTELSHAATH